MNSQERERIELSPLIHQVSGQSSFLQYDDVTLCKPIITREYHFYKNMPGQLLELTPQFKGIFLPNFTSLKKVKDHNRYYLQ